MDQDTFKDIDAAPQVHPAKSSRFIRMRKRTLQTFTALTQQPPASVTTNPPSIRVHSVARILVVFPVSASARGLGNVTSNAEIPQAFKQFVTVISLIGDQLPNHIALWTELLDILGRCYKSLFNGFGVAFIGWLDRDRHDSTGLQIHRVLRLMGQMRAAVFHLGNACIGIVRMGPVVIRSFLWPF